MSISNTQKFIAHIRNLIAKDDFKMAIQQLSALLKALSSDTTIRSLQ